MVDAIFNTTSKHPSRNILAFGRSTMIGLSWLFAKEIGAPKYRGSDCRIHGKVLRVTNGGGCFPCNLERCRARKLANPERIKEIQRRSAMKPECKETNRLASQRIRKRSPDRHRLWRQKNADRVRASRAAEYAANPEQAKCRTREWQKANPEQVKVLKATRRARERNAEGSHNAEDIMILRTAQKGKCAYCKSRLGASYHVDHIHPLSLGGSNSIKNIQLTCQSCNQRKGAKEPLVWARMTGRLL